MPISLQRATVAASLSVVASSGGILAVGKIANFSTRVLLARNLSVADFGLFNAAFAVISLVGSVATLGIQQSLVKYVPQSETIGHGSVRSLVRFALACVSVALFLSILVLATLEFVLSISVVEGLSSWPWLFMAIAIPGYTISFFFAYLLLSRHKTKSYVLALHMAQPLLFALIAFVLSWINAVSMSTVMASYMISIWVVAFYLLFGNRDCWFGRGSELVVGKQNFLRFSFTVLGSTAAYVALTSFDRLMLNWLSVSEEVAYYSVAYTIAALLPLATIVADAIASPKISRGFAGNDYKVVATVYQATNRVMSWYAGLVSVAILILSGPILSLFGTEYATALPILAILVLGEFYNLMLGTTGRVLQLGGQEQYEALLVWLVLTLNVVSNLILIPIYGAWGAAITTAMTRILHSSLKALLVYRFFKIAPWNKSTLTLRWFGMMLVVSVVILWNSVTKNFLI